MPLERTIHLRGVCVVHRHFIQAPKVVVANLTPLEVVCHASAAAPGPIVLPRDKGGKLHSNLT